MPIGAVPRITAVVALAMAALQPAEAPAQVVNTSQYTFLKQVPLPAFNENDIGLIIDLVFDLCNNSRVTHLANGPYRRISNSPGTNLTSQGDARHDVVVWDSATGNIPSTIEVKATGKGSISEQIGINPGVSLTASIDYNNNTRMLSITDTTGANGQSAQIVDAGTDPVTGKRVGGFDAVIALKNGTVKTADIICDQNISYVTGTAPNFNVVYGFQPVQLSDIANRLLVMWVMGPSGAGTPGNIATVCGVFNPADQVPVRDYSTSPPTYIDPPSSAADPVSSYESGSNYLREYQTINVSARGVRAYGDPELPVEVTSCNGFNTYCDQSEPTPAIEGASGNACNRNRGHGSPPTPYNDALNAENATKLVCIGGSCTLMYVPP